MQRLENNKNLIAFMLSPQDPLIFEFEENLFLEPIHGISMRASRGDSINDILFPVFLKK